MRLAREFRRPDWRRMLAEMSATELGEWAEHFGKNSFSDMLLDAEFATLTTEQIQTEPPPGGFVVLRG